jgi:hypothetical protein
MLAKASFFAENVQPSTSENMRWAICFGDHCAYPGSRSRMNQAFSANRHAFQVQRNSAPRTYLLYRFDIRHRNGLAVAGIIGDRKHHEGDSGGALRGNQGFGHEWYRNACSKARWGPTA